MFKLKKTLLLAIALFTSPILYDTASFKEKAKEMKQKRKQKAILYKYIFLHSWLIRIYPLHYRERFDMIEDLQDKIEQGKWKNIWLFMCREFLSLLLIAIPMRFEQSIKSITKLLSNSKNIPPKILTDLELPDEVFETLTSTQQEIFSMRFILGLSLSKVAYDLKLPLDQVSREQRRIIRIIIDNLDGE